MYGFLKGYLQIIESIWGEILYWGLDGKLAKEFIVFWGDFILVFDGNLAKVFIVFRSDSVLGFWGRIGHVFIAFLWEILYWVFGRKFADVLGYWGMYYGFFIGVNLRDGGDTGRRDFTFTKSSSGVSFIKSKVEQFGHFTNSFEGEKIIASSLCPHFTQWHSIIIHLLIYWYIFALDTVMTLFFKHHGLFILLHICFEYYCCFVLFLSIIDY